MGDYTNCKGFDLRSTKALTNKDVIKVCQLLNERFGEGYEFKPEAITEGGILMKQWPNKKQGEYKTLRFSFPHDGQWPTISDNLIEEWKTGQEQIIFKSENNNKDLILSLRLKAFYGAPCWTLQELRILEECFQKIGFLRKGQFPLQKSLKEYGESGCPINPLHT